MSRVAKNQPLNKQMYRHFAVITVMLTLVLAIFADGSNREALTDRMRTERQRTELDQADAKMFGKHKLGGTNASGQVQAPGGDSESTDDTGPQFETTKTTRTAQYRGDGGGEGPEVITFNDLGIAQLPTKAGVIVSGSHGLPPGLGPLSPKSGQSSGKKQGPVPGAAKVPSQAQRNHLVDSGFQDAGAPTQ